MKPREIKNLERFLRQERISGSENGRTLSTKVQIDKKKTYNRQKEKRNQNDSSYLFITNFLLKHCLDFRFFLFGLRGSSFNAISMSLAWIFLCSNLEIHTKLDTSLLSF